MTRTSFPFFQLSRELGVPYGAVLAYRSAVLKRRGDLGDETWADELDYWERKALTLYDETAVGSAILTAILEEQGRRYVVVHGDCRHD